MGDYKKTGDGSQAKSGINWYPGHMLKARKTLEENLKLVNIVIELCDARLPYSSRNPVIDSIIGNKPRVLVFNKKDLADESMNAYWRKYYEEKNYKVVFTDAKAGNGVKDVIKAVNEVLADKISRERAKGRINSTLYAMVVGIPNVGKSSFINRVAGKAVAVTGDKPGVTREKQWLKMTDEIYLMDTPGLLWPKIENQLAAMRLASSGAIKDAVVDTGELCAFLLTYIEKKYPGALEKRFNIKTDEPEDNDDDFDYVAESVIGSSNLKRGLRLLELCGRSRGCLLKGGEVDLDRAAITVLDEFRAGKIGRITLDFPEVIEEDAEISEKNRQKQAYKEERRRERKAEYKRKNK